MLGWLGYFGICTAGAERDLHTADAHLRRRMRAIQLAHWKRKRTIATKLTKLGGSKRAAWRGAYKDRRSWWALRHSPAVDRGLRNAYFAERGLVSLAEQWRVRHPPASPSRAASAQRLRARRKRVRAESRGTR